MRPSQAAKLILVVLIVVNLVYVSTLTAQTVLQRLEEQIRQRVAPSQGGAAPSQQPGVLPPPPPAGLVDNASAANRPTLGYLGAVADDRKDRGRGVRITDVRPGGPADKAGLRNQDLVTALQGTRVRQLSDMTEILRLYQPNDVVEFDILRDNEPQKIKVTLGQRPSSQSAAGHNAEVIPLPQGEMVLPDPSNSRKPQTSAKVAAPTVPPAESRPPTDAEKIEQLQNRVAELERRVADLERALAQAQKKSE